MSKINTKSLMVLSIVSLSLISMPIMVMGAQNQDDSSPLQQPGPGFIQGFTGGFGNLFANPLLGKGGEILGTIFKLLFMQGLNFTHYEMLNNVFVLSATEEENTTGTRYFSGVPEIHHLPYVDNNGTNAYNDSSINGFAYCVVTKTGGFTYNLTQGAGITLIVWDNDRSFVTAAAKIIGFVRKMQNNQYQDNQQALISDAVSLATWLLIHINDIFTGDELFVLNPITWQSLKINPLPGSQITKEWFQSKDDYINNGNDIPIPNNSPILSDWNKTADRLGDNYMQWLLGSPNATDLAETHYTQFSFDIVQFWMKTFHLSIDVSAILNGFNSGNVNLAKAFGGCNIEFYLFTHHLMGAYLYNDTDNNGALSVNYQKVLNKTTGEPIQVNGTDVQVPNMSELRDQIVLAKVNKFEFMKPKIEGGNKVVWGLNATGVQVVPVPFGVDINSYSGAQKENLDYITFGLTFQPKLSDIIEVNQTGAKYRVASGAVKLNQEFAPLNGDGRPNNVNNTGLDMAIIYISTVFHFHLKVTQTTQNNQEQSILNTTKSYDARDHKLMIGDYLHQNFKDYVNFVDIAGPYYEYGNQTSNLHTAHASTSIIPLALWQGQRDQYKTFQDVNHQQTVAQNVTINTDVNVMLYAVCYPEYNGGNGIWNDPTFSVYMVFQAKGVWAIVFLIAGVSLFGVATVLIKRYKDRR